MRVVWRMVLLLWPLLLISCQQGVGVDAIRKSAGTGAPPQTEKPLNQYAYDDGGLAAALSSGDPLQAAAATGGDAVMAALGLDAQQETDERYQSEMAWVLSGLASAAGDALSSEARMALQQGEIPDAAQVGTRVADRTVVAALDGAAGLVRGTGVPFLRNLEAQFDVRRGQKPSYELRAIDALYESENLRHTVFAEGGVARGDDRTTMNIGAGYRYMTEDELWLYGVNAFYDREWPYNHERGSIGVEATSTLIRLFANRYMALSGWTDTRPGYQEAPLGGWDAGLSGRMPFMPEVELTGTGFLWDRHQGEDDLRGVQMDVEYTPFSMVTLGVSTRRDSDGETTVGASVNFNLNAEKVEREMRPESVRDLRLQKVKRENRIIVQERQAPATTGMVQETVGNNSVALPDGTTVPLAVGMSLPYGSTITVDAAGGSYAQIEFGNGGVLRIGTNSVVTIDMTTITLVSGTLQYVSGATNVNINVPGGSVELVGTDVDAVSDGTNTTVRVRDGTIRVGGVTAQDGQIVQAGGGIIAAGTAAARNHASAIYNRIDSIDPSVLAIAKAAPYVYQSVFVQQAPTVVGDALVLGVSFSKPVTLTGAVTLDFTLNGVARSATYNSGNGSDEILFSYTTQPADAGEDEAVISEVSLNGGSIEGGGIVAVEYVPGVTVELDNGAIVPNGVTTTVSVAAASPTNISPIEFTIVFAEAMTGLTAGELTVTNGTAANLATGDNITWTVDITPTAQGTVSVQVPAAAAQSGTPEDNAQSNTASIVYNLGAPMGQAVTFTTDPVNPGNVTAGAFQMTGAMVGATYAYTISSSGGGTNVTGSGTVATATQNFTALNLSGLNDGTLTVSMVLTGPLGDVAGAVTDTVVKDIVAPTITSVTGPADGVYDDL